MRNEYFKLSHAEYYVENWPGSTKNELIEYAVQDFEPHPSNEQRFRRRVSDIFDVAIASAADMGDEDDDGLPIIGGILEAAEDMRQWATGTTFVFTSAQANTILNEKFWASLMGLVEDRQAQLHISRFTYNKASHGKRSVKPGSYDGTEDDDIWFDPRIAPFVSDEQVQVASDLVWCGELNIIPTRVDPITGFENYGRGSSIILPHTKMAMRSVPTMKDFPARFCYTTGTVTARNYIEKAAGQKASLHHVYGALLVELDEHGQWWARQINADADGTVYDLTDKYTPDGQIERNVPVEIITHGDIHGNKVDTSVVGVMTGEGGVLDQLTPRHQVFHDSIDFQPRNHHNIRDPHFLHQMKAEGKDNVMQEFGFTAEVLTAFMRDTSRHYIVTSNHDQAIEGWLRNTAGFYDPENLWFWLAMNLYCTERRESGMKPRPFAEALSNALGAEAWAFSFIHEDDSLVIAGIENGLHGHLGPNGARGNPKNLRTVGKANTGHTHSAGIVDGVYTAGVFGNLDMGYNKGLSSWSHSFIVTYQNGKRTIVTIKDGKAWR
ncbi:DNA transfer protein [Paracoccus phage ParKuw1]|uniref:DNA transfer protein n=1 Tax=Paracoccus phage ParKuw1 TaxID=3032415 RepID=A0AAF0JIS3_9CAUD|nr:DNA transfer protein [Paracoccus phage ParKuw1]